MPAAALDSSATAARAAKAPFHPQRLDIVDAVLPARTPPRYPMLSIRPEAVAPPCLPPKSREIAPAREAKRRDQQQRGRHAHAGEDDGGATGLAEPVTHDASENDRDAAHEGKEGALMRGAGDSHAQ